MSAKDALHEHRREQALELRREHLLNQCKIGITKNELLAASLEIKRHVVECEHHAKDAQFRCQAEKASLATAMRRAFNKKVERENAECLAEIAKLQKEERTLQLKLNKARNASKENARGEEEAEGEETVTEDGT